jgi:hypothetical protein
MINLDDPLNWPAITSDSASNGYRAWIRTLNNVDDPLYGLTQQRRTIVQADDCGWARVFLEGGRDADPVGCKRRKTVDRNRRC